MKVTVEEIVNVSTALDYLSNKDGLFISNQVFRNMKLVKDIVADFNQDKKVLIDKYVSKNEDGSYIIKENGNYEFMDKNEAFATEVLAMISDEHEIEFVTFKLDDIKSDKGEKVNIPAVYLMALDEKVIVE